MITKEQFVTIINRLKETDEMVDKINNIIRNSTDSIISDFTNAGSIMICHEDIVLQLLENIFNDTDTISWWLYEKDYGRDIRMKMWDEQGNEIDVSTPEKLYDYLVESIDKK